MLLTALRLEKGRSYFHTELSVQVHREIKEEESSSQRTKWLTDFDQSELLD